MEFSGAIAIQKGLVLALETGLTPPIVESGAWMWSISLKVILVVEVKWGGSFMKSRICFSLRILSKQIMCQVTLTKQPSHGKPCIKKLGKRSSDKRKMQTMYKFVMSGISLTLIGWTFSWAVIMQIVCGNSGNVST